MRNARAGKIFSLKHVSVGRLRCAHLPYGAWNKHKIYFLYRAAAYFYIQTIITNRSLLVFKIKDFQSTFIYLKYTVTVYNVRIPYIHIINDKLC